MRRLLPLAVVAAVLVMLVGAIWQSSKHSWSMEAGTQTDCPPPEPLQYCTIEQPIGGRGYAMSDVSPDGASILVAGGGQYAVWSLADGQLVTRKRISTGSLRAAGFAPDGKTILAATTDTIQQFNLADGAQIQGLSGHQDIIGRMDVSNDGAMLAVSDEFELRLWSLEDGSVLHTLITGRVMSRALDFSPDDSLLAVGRRNNPVQFYDVESGGLAYTLPEENVFGLAFSPDGQSIYTAGYSDRIKRWDAANGTFIEEIGGHDFNIVALAISADGSRLATGARDGVKVWDLTRNQLIVTLENFDVVSALSFSPNNEYLLVSGMNPMVRLWRLP